MIKHLFCRHSVLPTRDECRVEGFRESAWTDATPTERVETCRVEVTGNRLGRHDSRPVTWRYDLTQAELDQLCLQADTVPDAGHGVPGQLDEGRSKQASVVVSPNIEAGFVRSAKDVYYYLEFRKGEHRLRARIAGDGPLGRLRKFFGDLSLPIN